MTEVDGLTLQDSWTTFGFDRSRNHEAQTLKQSQI